MSKFLRLYLVLSKMQNLLLLRGPLEAFLGFFGLLRLKSKMKNNHIFVKNLHGI
jgi:hypothetical protein